MSQKYRAYSDSFFARDVIWQRNIGFYVIMDLAGDK